MLLGKLKYTLIFTALLIGLFGIGYMSKPDIGGLKRCEEIFRFNSLDHYGLKILPLLTWKPFEGSKFRMRIEEEKFEYFKIYLYGQGFKDWEEGGLEFGSFIIGCDNSESLQYSIKKFWGHEQIIAYDEAKNLIYAINFQ